MFFKPGLSYSQCPGGVPGPHALCARSHSKRGASVISCISPYHHCLVIWLPPFLDCELLVGKTHSLFRDGVPEPSTALNAHSTKNLLRVLFTSPRQHSHGHCLSPDSSLGLVLNSSLFLFP